MKLITAIIQPTKLDPVREALAHAGIDGMTVTEVKGYGRGKAHAEGGSSDMHEGRFEPKLRIEVALPDEITERAVEAISTAARTGEVGDGKIFVLPIAHATRIRTGEADSDAL